MFYRAKILSYNAQNRTANVHIIGLTDGAEDGLTATFAYAVGDDDRDTELKIVAGNDCYVFFESNDPARPVIAFYASHGTGALTDIRRIQQKNIELLAQIKATIEANTIHLKGNLIIDGNITHTGNTTQIGNNIVNGTLNTTGAITSGTDVLAGTTSLKLHTHGGVQNGGGSTTPPIS